MGREFTASHWRAVNKIKPSIERKPLPMPNTTVRLRPMYVGLDVHKDTIVVALADDDRREARLFGTIVNTTAALERLLRRLAKAHTDRRWIFCYEAGP